MIYINDTVKEKISKLKVDNFYVLADFDRTITPSTSKTSWDILERNDFVCTEFTKLSAELYDFYHPIEFDPDIDEESKSKYMDEWWIKITDILIKYNVTEDKVNTAVVSNNIMEFRDGAKEFIDLTNKYNIPFVIVSAGIGNFIEQFLKHNNSLHDNIHIASNFLKFENNIITGFMDNPIHTLNKHPIALSDKVLSSISSKKYILLFGDNDYDVYMEPKGKREDTIRIGFLEKNVDANLEKYKNVFDILCVGNTSFIEILNVLNLN